MSIARAIGQGVINAAWLATRPRGLVPTGGGSPKPKRRTFSAAKVGRLNASWRPSQTTIDYDLQAGLRSLRNRSRDLAQNNEYARGWLNQVRANVIGPQGISLQVRARRRNGRLDERANTLIEDAWRAWSKAGRWEATGRLSRADGERLLIEGAARDGEILLRIIRGYRANQRYAVQILEPDLLDEDLNHKLSDGRQIRMGVELDSYFRPVAYHLLTSHPGDTTWQRGGRRYERVLAQDIIHAFVPLRPLQTRGVPWMHAAMVGLQDLGGYRESAIVAAKVGAAQMGFYTTPDGIPVGGGSDVDALNGGAGHGPDGEMPEEVEPGTFVTLPEGVSLQSWNPQYPHDQFADFNKATLRGIAAAFGSSYHTLANDLESVNFSSGRLGAQSERDTWQCLQEWFIDSVCNPLYADWLRYHLADQTIPLQMIRFDDFNAPAFTGRRWQSIDPLKDVNADIAAIDAGLKTRSECIRARGLDPLDVWRERQREEQTLSELGIKSDTAAAPDDNTETDDE